MYDIAEEKNSTISLEQQAELRSIEINLKEQMQLVKDRMRSIEKEIFY